MNRITDLGHVANLLYMLRGEVPDEDHERALTTYLNTVVDHGMNASTFTARVIVSTRSDFISAVTGAIGALKGPLHGGAPGPVLAMLEEIGEPGNAESYLRRKLESGERLMGFGHAVYRVRDPRADVLSRAARSFFDDGDDLYALALHTEKTAIKLLEEYKPGRRLQTNVEFYTALLLRGLGIHSELFTPMFAIGRVAGWVSHCFEQRAVDRIFRPESRYTGNKGGRWSSIEIVDRSCTALSRITSGPAWFECDLWLTSPDRAWPKYPGISVLFILILDSTRTQKISLGTQLNLLLAIAG